MKFLKLTLCAILVSGIFATAAKADIPAVSFTSPGNYLNNGLGYSLGFSFSSSTSFTVTALGYFDAFGLGETHSVAIYTAGGTEVASYPTIDGTGSQIGFFNYESISPVSLAPGSYQIVGSSGYSDPYAYFPAGFSTAPNITFGLSVYTFGNGDEFGVDSEGLTGFFGPNFLETSAATPQPSSLALLGTGMAGLAGIIRRRLSK